MGWAEAICSGMGYGVMGRIKEIYLLQNKFYDNNQFWMKFRTLDGYLGDDETLHRCDIIINKQWLRCQIDRDDIRLPCQWNHKGKHSTPIRHDVAVHGSYIDCGCGGGSGGCLVAMTDCLMATAGSPSSVHRSWLPSV